MSDLVLVEQHGGVLVVTLNQPSRLNALNDAMWQGLAAAVRTAERDAGVRALVLTGAGQGFSSGADLTEFRPGEAGFDPGAGLRGRINPLVLRLRALEKPALAAINGVAAGAGLGLALACDLRIAAASARLVVAFVRIGLVPDAGCMYFLPRLVGQAKALELCWTGDAVSAQEAEALGLVNRVVPDGEALAATRELAERLARGPAKALGLMKRALNQAHELPLERVLELEVGYQTLAAREPDFIEGVAAFREKRPAQFGGPSSS
jgi:2-(1,2-epoxy-1,2-dihydrophenyl)acetyl-CoA isomerase